MAKQAVALRLAPDVIAQADELAKGRGVSRQVILESAVLDFLESAAGGVPDLVEEEAPRVKPVTPQGPVPSLMAGRQARLAKEMGW